jgi:hypothetical protein
MTTNTENNGIVRERTRAPVLPEVLLSHPSEVECTPVAGVIGQSGLFPVQSNFK